MSPSKSARRAWLAHIGAISTALLLAPWTRAQASGSWPDKPIRFVVPIAAGGATDSVARLIGEQLGGRLGQPIVVENRASAGGIVGTDMVAKATPDGQTILFSLSAPILTNQFLYRNLPYSTQRDLVLVSRVADAPLVLVVHSSLPVKTVPELLAYMKQNKGKLAYGSYGTGSVAHLSGAYLDKSQNANMVHAPYKGETAMLQDLVGGRIQLAFASAPGAKPYADGGRLRIIAVTGEQRMDVLPSIPTMAEQGLKDEAYRIVGFMAVAVPARTPVAVVERLAQEVISICRKPQIRERIVAMGFRPVGNTPEAFAASYKRELATWEMLVKVSGAQAE
ncbi:tripartite tricarboxylate transporter substrate binding protein [Cupriavidus sp. L7L]|uniref:Bug family tripartite tricarboxylate transporter substrate binding protein n=1 Tax=Cupriavidus sp. L7L TaxID=2546443 RepID=UPI0010548641|nr:tripartite tricarboxylate transporter substrate binding protein [Cupriavidus sp. L7L]TDF64542.1 tripartite tricarboxylate transporter substrate binding protein [Cupriavidus sp. L7L]